MTSSVTESNLERKFHGVTNTQDSIQTLSLWLLHHKAHHKKIVGSWMKVLKKAKVSQKLALFYLANDVIQNSKRKGIPFFKESFAEVLREATLFVRDEQIRNSVNRVFNIWNERSIYSSDFISDLQGILANAKAPPTAPTLKALAEFKCEKVIEKLKAVAKLEKEVSTKTASVNISKLNATNSEIVQKLKDRTHGQQFSREFDESVKCLEDLIKTLNKEIEERNELIILLEQSEVYYDTQRGEAKIVSNAYKNFGSRVKSVQKKLEEIMQTFGSPVPSPTPDAPSPTNSDMELELPGESASPDKVTPEEHEGEKNGTSCTSEALVTTAISFTSTAMTCVGNPIPTLSTLFPAVDQGKTASWFSSLAKSTPMTLQSAAASSSATSDSSSLDSRLSNLLQNIPNLPSGLQDTLLGKSMSDSNSQSSLPGRRSTSGLYDSTMGQKEDMSGQNTPLQDEESPATNSSSSFFSQLAAAPKASHSPKDILKGLTNLIQTAASKDKSQKAADKPVGWSLETSKPFEASSEANTRSSVIPSSVEPSLSLSSPLLNQFFTSPPMIVSSSNSVEASVSLSGFISTPAVVTQTASSYAPVQNVQRNLSFIPSIVPSAPNTTHYNYGSGENFDEYDPCSVNFKLDNDANSIGGLSNPSPMSESPSSPDEVLSGDELGETLNASRQSTLITLVSNTPGGTPVAEEKNENANTVPENSMPPATTQVTQIGWPNLPPINVSKPLYSMPFSESDKVEPMFTIPGSAVAKNGCPPPEPVAMPGAEPSNSWEPAKIETVQSPRNIRENRWFDNESSSYVPEQFSDFFQPEMEPYNPGPMIRNYHHQSPSPRMNNWRGRSRPFNNHGRRPMRKNFAPFPPRGRGRAWRPPLY